jgi:Holliday junction resolvase RusA-like endonuclease
MGWVTDHYGFDFNFIMFGVLSAMMIVLVITKIPETSLGQGHDERSDNTETALEQQQTTTRRTGKIMDLVLLALRPRVTVFLLEVLVMGAGMATVERLLFLYMVNDLDASTLLCGLSVGVNVLFELPIFWYASPIMTFLGHDGMFLLSMICFVVRVYGYTWLTPSTKWFILLLESMHGVTFASFWIVTTDVSKVLIETEGAFWSTAIPMSVQMLYSAVGVSVGSVLGGWAMHKYGSREMYTFTAATVLCMMIFHIVGSILARTCSSVGSFLPDFHHSSHATSGRDEGALVDEFTGEAIPPSPSEDSAPVNDHGDDTLSQHLTGTDIIQIGSLVEREDQKRPRGHSRTKQKRHGPLSVLVACLASQLPSSVSAFTEPLRIDPSLARKARLVNRQESTIDAESVNGISNAKEAIKAKAKRKRSVKMEQEAPVKHFHWKDESDSVVLETTPMGSKVTRLGFTVRGNPRPLRRHRTSRGHMYNPSLKYQQSFQEVVEKFLFSNSENDDHLPNNSSMSLDAPVFSAEENLVMTIIFRMKRPKSHFVNNRPGADRLKKTAPSHTSAIRTDVDNLTKFVLDSMNHVLYEDDRQVMSIHVTKLLDNDGMCEGSTEVYVRSIDERDIEHILGTSVALTEKYRGTGSCPLFMDALQGETLSRGTGSFR